MYARADSGFLDDLDDAELVSEFRNGNDLALHVLLRRHSDALYRFCVRLAPTREDAEDICQESLARAIDRVDSLAAGGAFRTWLFRIARNLLTDSFRARRRLCRLPDDDEPPPPLLREDGPQSHIELDEEHRTVSQAFRRLTESHQQVLMLREVEGLSYNDIARQLNVSHSAVETLLFRARRRLRQEYGKSERATLVPGIVASIRAMALRLSAPLTGGGTAATKVAVTAVVIGAAAATAHVARVGPASRDTVRPGVSAPVVHSGHELTQRAAAPSAAGPSPGSGDQLQARSEGQADRQPRPAAVTRRFAYRRSPAPASAPVHASTRMRRSRWASRATHVVESGNVRGGAIQAPVVRRAATSTTRHHAPKPPLFSRPISGNLVGRVTPSGRGRGVSTAAPKPPSFRHQSGRRQTFPGKGEGGRVKVSTAWMRQQHGHARAGVRRDHLRGSSYAARGHAPPVEASYPARGIGTTGSGGPNERHLSAGRPPAAHQAPGTGQSYGWAHHAHAAGGQSVKAPPSATVGSAGSSVAAGDSSAHGNRAHQGANTGQGSPATSSGQPGYGSSKSAQASPVPLTTPDPAATPPPATAASQGGSAAPVEQATVTAPTAAGFQTAPSTTTGHAGHGHGSKP